MRTLLLDIKDFLTQYIEVGDLNRLLLIPKIIGISLTVIFLIALIILFFKLKKNISESLKVFSQAIGVKDLPKRQTQKKWDEILKKVSSNDENAYKMAVIEADKLFDDLLIRIGLSGKDMGERLSQITQVQVSNINEVWQAHKMRNNLVHDPNFELSRFQADKSVKAFEKALKELQVL